MKTKMMKIRCGSVLVLAVIMVVILLIIGLALIRLGLNSRLQAVHSQLIIEAKTAADAGMTQAVKAMRYAFNHDLSLPVAGDSGTFSAPGESGASYTYTVTSDPNGGYLFYIDSIGTAGTVSRTVHSKLQLDQTRMGFKDGFNLNNNGCVATIPTGGDFTIQTNSTDRSKIVLRNGVVIPGNVVVGPGGSAGYVIDTKNNAEIQGESRPAAEAIDFKNVNPPSPLPVAAWPPSDYNSITKTYTIRDSGIYNSPITIKNGDTVKVVGDLDIYIAGKFVIQQGAYFVIGKKLTGQSSTLKLYLGDDMQADQLSNITNEYVGSGTPSADEALTATSSFSLYGTANMCATLPCQKITLLNSGTFYGSIYAPNAFVDIRNSGDMYISQLAAYNGSVGNGGCLNLVQGPIDPNSSTFAIKRWWEE